jgi:hypothetical protein
MDRVDVLDWYWGMPIVTRLYFSGCCAVTLACAADLITPFDVYYNWHAVAQRGQVWRVLTNFLFFGNFGIDFLFHMYFIVRYSRGLEEGRAFAGRPGDFLFCLAFGMAAIMAAAPFTSLLFFGQSLSFMLVYLWAKRNPDMQISLLGVRLPSASRFQQIRSARRNTSAFSCPLACLPARSLTHQPDFLLARPPTRPPARLPACRLARLLPPTLSLLDSRRPTSRGFCWPSRCCWATT